jgi:branched-chain amino acid transport system permease protein
MESLFSPQLIFAALLTGSLYGLVALGLNLIYGTMRLLNVAHGEIVMLGAYVTYWAFTLLALSPLLAMFLALAVAAALGLVVYFGLFRTALASPRLSARLEANSLLLFFGLSVILQNVAALLFTASPRGYRALDAVVSIAGVTVTQGRLAMLCVSLAVIAGVVVFLRLNMAGLAIKALIQSREATAIVGVDIERVQRLSFALGFGLAGLAGALVSLVEQISPFMGFPFTIAAFVVIILGGLGNLVGSLIAGFLVGALETFGVALTSANYRSILIYGVFILVLLIRPQGLLGGRRIVR